MNKNNSIFQYSQLSETIVVLPPQIQGHLVHSIFRHYGMHHESSWLVNWDAEQIRVASYLFELDYMMKTIEHFLVEFHSSLRENWVYYHLPLQIDRFSYFPEGCQMEHVILLPIMDHSNKLEFKVPMEGEGPGIIRIERDYQTNEDYEDYNHCFFSLFIEFDRIHLPGWNTSICIDQSIVCDNHPDPSSWMGNVLYPGDTWQDMNNRTLQQFAHSCHQSIDMGYANQSINIPYPIHQTSRLRIIWQKPPYSSQRERQDIQRQTILNLIADPASLHQHMPEFDDLPPLEDDDDIQNS